MAATIMIVLQAQLGVAACSCKQLYMGRQNVLLARDIASTHAGQLNLFTHAHAAELALESTQGSASMLIADQRC
jgi:hypothetical protein